MKAAVITRSGLALALTAVSFSLLTGTMNLLNALTIPAVFALFLTDHSRWEKAWTAVAYCGLVLLLFRSQLFFAPVYWLLFFMSTAPGSSLGPWWKQWLTLSIAAWLGFLAAIRGTDWLLGTGLEAMMLAVAGGSVPVYAGVIFGEALLITGLLVLIKRRWLFRLQRLLQK